MHGTQHGWESLSQLLTYQWTNQQELHRTMDTRQFLQLWEDLLPFIELPAKHEVGSFDSSNAYGFPTAGGVSSTGFLGSNSEVESIRRCAGNAGYAAPSSLDLRSAPVPGCNSRLKGRSCSKTKLHGFCTDLQLLKQCQQVLRVASWSSVPSKPSIGLVCRRARNIS